jgi:hypothetical protein
MSVIKDVDKSHQRLIETLNRKHERKVKQMNEAHDENVAQIRQGQHMDVVNLQDQHDRHITDENDRKERILMQMKANLDEQKRLTDKELKNLGEYKNKEAMDIQAKNANDRMRISGEHEEHLTLMNDKYNQAVRRINTEGQERVDLMNEQQRDLYDDRANFHQKRLDALHKEKTTVFKKNTEDNLRTKNEMKKSFEKERMTTHKKHEADITKMSKDHEKLYSKKDLLQREDLKQQELFFEKRYADTYKRHNEHFEVLDGVHDKVVKKMQADLTKQVEFKNARSEDPFFQFVELKPTLEHTEDGVKIQVKGPDHSKQDLQLNLNDKEAIVNFNRRYIDNQKDDQGNVSRVSKIETLSTRLQTGVHLDPKSVKHSYKDGVMTYTIKKA